MEKVFLIHGWSATETTTYQALHLQLAQHGFDLHHIYLGRYVSLDDAVEVSDIAHAMDQALLEQLGKPPWTGRLHMITHSTGALVVKQWLTDYYSGPRAEKRPLKNILFLAAPHFGSRLAHHGRAMVSRVLITRGPSGKRILNALELGSAHSWAANGTLLAADGWLGKGIRPFCLAGDRVPRDLFKSRIFPAAFETGSDGVVRVPAANLNFRRYRLDAGTRRFRKLGAVTGVPFAALERYVHSDVEHGIMNSITTQADVRKPAYQNLKLMLECLRVRNSADYTRLQGRLSRVTQTTRKKRRAFAQLDLWFHDETGAPIDDYVWELGVYVDGRERPSKTIAHTHKNTIDGSRFTVFLDLGHFEPDSAYFMRISTASGTPLYHYHPGEFTVQLSGRQLLDIISADQTTQVEVVFGRRAHSRLFRFHRGDDEDLHVSWDREGEITKSGIPPK
ncbi:MAG: hypothetical protein WBO06_00500 [Gammaproteobacteria bacterium]